MQASGVPWVLEDLDSLLIYQVNLDKSLLILGLVFTGATLYGIIKTDHFNPSQWSFAVSKIFPILRKLSLGRLSNLPKATWKLGSPAVQTQC